MRPRNTSKLFQALTRLVANHRLVISIAAVVAAVKNNPRLNP
jgi:hypothetical protein